MSEITAEANAATAKFLPAHEYTPERLALRIAACGNDTQLSLQYIFEAALHGAHGLGIYAVHNVINLCNMLSAQNRMNLNWAVVSAGNNGPLYIASNANPSFMVGYTLYGVLCAGIAFPKC